jgi:hypothetical protein
MKSCFVTPSFISQLKWIDKHRYTEELRICWCVYFCFGNSGRRITSSGQRDLDQVAGRIVVAPWSSNVELCYNCLTLGFSFNPGEMWLQRQDYMLWRFWSQLWMFLMWRWFLLCCISMIRYFFVLLDPFSNIFRIKLN